MTASKIEWTGRSDWNPVRGCTRASEGCRHCYAETIAARFSDPGQAFHGFATRTTSGPRWTGKVELVENRLTLPLRWRKPATIFASSTSDIFHESLSDADIDRIFAVMALTPHHTYQVLTKRAERMRSYVSRNLTNGCGLDRVIGTEMLGEFNRAIGERRKLPVFALPLPNVWLGVSTEDQRTADERIPHLLATPAANRFLSCEPLIGRIDFDPCELTRVDWVIVGGESGRGARPMHPDWARSLRDQCAIAFVPFFFKQWGEWAPVSDIDLDALYDDIYHPAPARDPEATRRCKVAECVLHRDGLRFEHGEWEKTVAGERVMAFQGGHGAMTMLQLDKHRSGRLLDGKLYDAIPTNGWRTPFSSATVSTGPAPMLSDPASPANVEECRS